MADIIAAVARNPEGITPRNLKVLLPGIDPARVDTYLKRAHDAGRIAKFGRGKYGPVPQTSPL